MRRFSTLVGDYVSAVTPRSATDVPADAVLAECAAAGGGPDLIYWDVSTGDDGQVGWGLGGLDPYLAASNDLAGCAAVSQAALDRLFERGGIERRDDISRAVALLARSANTSQRHCPDLRGDLEALARAPLAAGAPGRPGGAADRLSVVVLLTPDAPSPQALFDALPGQTLSGRAELIVASLGLASAAYQTAGRAAEDLAARDTRYRARRYAFDTDVPLPYAANALVALAGSDAVLFVDPAVRPLSASLLQTLADWTASADVAAAAPALEYDGELAAAGLSVAGDDEAPTLRAGRQHVFSDTVRLAAAPGPWVFAANRRLWLASGGAPPWAHTQLWTAMFATRHGPAGRTLYVGNARAAWVGAEPPKGLRDEAPVAGALSRAAGLALRAAPAGAPGRAVSSSAPVAAPAEPWAMLTTSPVDAPEMFIDDPVATHADCRVLVFADDYGPSQAILFEHALAEARGAARLAVFLVREADFRGDGRSLNDPDATGRVEAAFAAAQPDIVVISRLGHGMMWQAIHAAARQAGLPIVCHLDDDLLDLPAYIGIERYRLGRAPRRLATLQSGLDLADLVLATTPALATKLQTYVAHGRIRALEAGAAGAVLGRRRPPTSDRVRIGYMGSASHNADLQLVVPALNRIAEAFPQVEIDLFGSIARQPAAAGLAAAGERHPPVIGDYEGFLGRLTELEWDIGLAPLRATPFNTLKTPIKWAEYASAGIPVAASHTGPYKGIIQSGAALGVGDASWETALRKLITEPALRQSLMATADRLLTSQFSWDRLGQAVEAALASACARRRTAA